MEKIMTPEEKREATRDFARMTLEDKVLQQIYGIGEVMNDQARYGQLNANGAKNSYDEVINSETVQKIREKIYNEKREKAKEKRIYAKPSVSDYDVELYIKEQIDECKPLVSLKTLDGIVKGVTGDLGFEVPKELGDYLPVELQEKIAKKAEEKQKRQEKLSSTELIAEALNEEERVALGIYEGLSMLYNRGVAENASDKYQDITDSLKQIIEAYNSKKGEK